MNIDQYFDNKYENTDNKRNMSIYKHMKTKRSKKQNNSSRKNDIRSSENKIQTKKKIILSTRLFAIHMYCILEK